MKRSRRFLTPFFLVFLLLLSVYYYAQNIRIFFPRAGTLIPEKKLNSKLKRIEQKLEKNPGDLKALVDKGVVCFFKGPSSMADALNALNTAWQFGALDKRIFYYSGILYENLSLFEESQRQYERFLRHEPDDREIQMRLARLLFRMEKWDEAVNVYQELIGKNPNDVTALINCGLAYAKRLDELKTGKKKLEEKEKEEMLICVQEGVHYLESASKIQKELPEGIYLTLAKLYQENGNFEKAVSACQYEIKKSTNAAEPLLILGNAYEKLNQQENALETYNQLSGLLPRNNTVQSKIRSLKKQLKKK